MSGVYVGRHRRPSPPTPARSERRAHGKRIKAARWDAITDLVLADRELRGPAR